MLPLTILPEDDANARDYATRSLDHTYNRMGKKRQFRWDRIYVGKIVEATVRRYISDELGLEINYAPTPHTDSEDKDFLITVDSQNANEAKALSVSVKSVILFPTYKEETREPAQFINEGWALVPCDQFASHPNDVYLFAFFFGTLNGEGAERQISPDSKAYGLWWATQHDITQWEIVPEGEQRFPYIGTRTRNHGCPVASLHDEKNLVRWVTTGVA